jgi:hypothetical protein
MASPNHTHLMNEAQRAKILHITYGRHAKSIVFDKTTNMVTVEFHRSVHRIVVSYNGRVVRHNKTNTNQDHSHA